VRLHEDGLEFGGDRAQFSDVRRSSPKQEVEIDRGHRRALQRGGGVADQHHFEVMALQESSDARQ
jgi:hypothetical protein